MRRQLIIDFESASACDLKVCGADVYAENPTTEVLCLCVRDAVTGEQWSWHPGQDRQWLLDLLAGNHVWIAHNARMERAMWAKQMVALHGFPPIPLEQWHDTMAVCAMKALPLKLEHVADKLRLPVQKDMEGHRFTIGLSKLDKGGYYLRAPTAYQRVIDYCFGDVETQAALHRRVGWLTPDERKVWLLDQQINDRGVMIDREFVSKARLVVDRASEPLMAEFKRITGNTVNQRDRNLEWLRANGVVLPDMKKETLDSVLGGDEHGWDEDVDWDLLATNLQPDVERALRIRQLIGSASIKKLNKMEHCVCSDGAARGLLQYHGAGTGRWAGRLLQPQNFPRPTIIISKKPPDPDMLVEAIKTGDPQYVEALIGPPVEAIVGGLRHAIVARPNRLLLVGDYAGVEARLVLALAGQHDKTALMASGADVYCHMATSIYEREITKDDIEERTIGKNTILGCGFGMGENKFFKRYARRQTLLFCKRVINTYRNEWAPKVPQLWKGLEIAALTAMRNPGCTAEAFGVEYKLIDEFLTARLPSGRLLWYFQPRLVVNPAPWDEDVLLPGIVYKVMKQGQWITAKAYGGLLTENVVQALARDLMVHGMRLCEQENLPVILTVHDEIVTEPEARRADPKLLQQIMEDRPEWARQIQAPITAETWAGPRYRK